MSARLSRRRPTTQRSRIGEAAIERIAKAPLIISARTGDTFSFYSDVPSILHSAYTLPIALALASRTHAPDLANKALKLLHIRSPAAEDSSDVEPSTMAPIRAWDFFKYKEIFPGDKKTHMRNIQKDSGVGFESMLFFDDESRNRNVESLGVTFWLVEDGISIREIDNGVREWRKMKGR